MKILIVSDTHRSNSNFLEALECEGKIDVLIHAGDVEGSEYLYTEAIDGDVYMVSGNNDFFSPLEREEEFDIGGYHFLLTHGHYYRVNMGYEILKEEAQARGADIVIYGHIHRPVVEFEDGLWIINPGSLSYPRQVGHQPTYAVMNLRAGFDPEIEIKYL